MNNSKISVIVPTYNRGQLIGRTIESVISQTIQDWELIIVDDGSTDGTKEIVNEFVKKDKRIKYFYQENSGGPSEPRNLGVEKAKGEYIAFLDSDDIWNKTKLQKQLNLFISSNNSKLGIVACFGYIKDNKTGRILEKRDIFYRGNVIKELVKTSFLFTASCIMTKLSILKEVGIFDNNFKVSDDYDMWIRISKLGYEIDFVPEYLLDYVVNGDNIFYNNKNFNERKEFAILCGKHEKLFLKYNHLMIAYYYILTKQYKLSRKYLIPMFTKNELNKKERIKAFGYFIVSFLPFLEIFFLKVWRRIKFIFD